MVKPNLLPMRPLFFTCFLCISLSVSSAACMEIFLPADRAVSLVDAATLPVRLMSFPAVMVRLLSFPVTDAAPLFEIAVVCPCPFSSRWVSAVMRMSFPA